MTAHRIGQLCVIRPSPHFHPSAHGELVVVTSHPYPIGPVTDTRSTMFGLPETTLIQNVRFHDQANQEQADKWLSSLDVTFHLASMPEYLEPINDWRERGEWTEELRKLCGLQAKVSA